MPPRDDYSLIFFFEVVGGRKTKFSPPPALIKVSSSLHTLELKYNMIVEQLLHNLNL